VRKRDRSEEVDHAAGKVVFPVGVAPLVVVHPAHGVQTGPGGHATRAVACEHVAGLCNVDSGPCGALPQCRAEAVNQLPSRGCFTKHDSNVTQSHAGSNA
jgi:hypothetical protein